MNNSSQIELAKYWSTIIRRKNLFIAVSLIVLSCIVWGSFFMPELYEAKSTVFIEQSVIKEIIQGRSFRRSGRGDDNLRGLKHTMLSKKVILGALKEVDFDAMSNNETEMASIIRKFARNTTIDAHNRENYFIVSYKGEEPKIVQAYVNALVAEYIEAITNLKQEDAYGASKFISEQIDFYKTKIAEIEQKLANFRRDEGIYLAIDERSLVSSIKGYQEEIEDVVMEIQKLEAKRKKISQQISGETPFTLAMVDNGGENTLPARLRSLEHRLQVLLTKYTDNYPEVVKTKIEIEELKKLLNSPSMTSAKAENDGRDPSAGMSMMNPIYQQLKEELLSIESEVDSLKAKQATLNNRIRRAEGELKNIPENKKILANLERDRDTHQTVYEQLLAKMGQAEVNEQVEAQNKGETFKVIDRASLPTKPVSPDRVIIILFALFAGIAAGMGAVLLKEKLDTSIRDVDILKAELKMKVLAIIPEIVSSQETQQKRKFDRNIYAVSIVYLLIIGGVFVREFINQYF